jgi:hypothetical protein
VQDLLQNFLKSLSAILCCGAFIAICTAFVIVSRRSSVSRAWEPLVPVVNGTLERKYMTALLRGIYQAYAVSATLLTGGAEDPDTFQIEMRTAARGANWLAKYGSKKLFGKDEWYVKADHPILQQRLDESGFLAELQDWDGHPTISYRSDPGTLIYEETGSVPKPDRFRAELDLLVRLARINEQVNTGAYLES